MERPTLITPRLRGSSGTFGHVVEVGQLLRHVLVLDGGGGVLQEASLLQGAVILHSLLRRRQSPRQEPEGHGRGQGDDPCYQVAQPPGAHPPCIAGSNGDGLCRGRGGRMGMDEQGSGGAGVDGYSWLSHLIWICAVEYISDSHIF